MWEDRRIALIQVYIIRISGLLIIMETNLPEVPRATQVMSCDPRCTVADSHILNVACRNEMVIQVSLCAVHTLTFMSVSPT